VTRVAGMASRLVRGTAIAAGVAALAGLGIGFAAGKPVDPKDILPARKLPADLCSRLGDVSQLLPKATTGTPAPKLVQTGASAVRCGAKADASTQPAHTSAELIITITPYAGKDSGAGQSPFKPDAVARQAFDRKALEVVPGRPSTKMDSRENTGGQSWNVTVLALNADIVVQVDYNAHPIERGAAEQAAQVMADRAIWESK
jgi:hypothetical protein